MQEGQNFWGSLIVQLRSEKKLSQRQLADELKINRGKLRRIEEGSVCGNIDLVDRVLRYFGYELEAISTNTGVAARKGRVIVVKAGKVIKLD